VTLVAPAVRESDATGVASSSGVQAGSPRRLLSTIGVASGDAASVAGLVVDLARSPVGGAPVAANATCSPVARLELASTGIATVAGVDASYLMRTRTTRTETPRFHRSSMLSSVPICAAFRSSSGSGISMRFSGPSNSRRSRRPYFFFLSLSRSGFGASPLSSSSTVPASLDFHGLELT
jgi:hypothetical protein